jgi:hypothetical protein
MNVSAPSALRLFILAALLSLVAAPALAQQNAGTDYTASMPSVAKVEAQMQGTDPVDTAARQVAVFEYLQVYIRRIKDTRQYNGPFTPGELRLMTDYAKAQYDVTQSFTKTHTPDEIKRFNRLEGNYSLNNALTWIKQLEGQQAADTYRGAESSLAQTYQQHEAQLQQQMKQDNGQSGGLLDSMFGGGGGGPLDAKQKRCLELGGTYDQCAGALMGAMSALGSLLTLGASNDSADAPPPLSGVVLVGSYHSRIDLAELGLGWDGDATLQKCGTLVDADHAYTLRKSGATTQIVVDNEPAPIVLTMRPDGSLSGPGSISVKGQIVSGYHNQYSCVNGQCSTSSTPIYSPSMQRCTLSLLAPQPAPPPPPKPTGLVGQLTDMLGDGDPKATIYGLRVTGPYAGPNGMLLSFDNGNVTLDCGHAHVNSPYTVDNTGAGFVIHVQNAGGAFLLGVSPDNTLRGSGSTIVNGKLVSSVNGKVVNFTPHSETCNVGTFMPKGKRNTMIASNAPMPAAPMSYPASQEPVSAAAPPISTATAPASTTGSLESSLAGAGISAAPNASKTQLRVLLSSNFTGTNPLAGQAVFVSRKPMDQILRELGVAIPANATPAQAMKLLQTLCHSTQGCTSVMQKLPTYYVSTAKLDTAGKATLNATAATGAYYFFTIIPSNGGSMMWDLPANLAAGDNSVTFTAANAALVQ